MFLPRARREAPQVPVVLPRPTEVAVSSAEVTAADVSTFVLDDRMTSPIGGSSFVQLNNSSVHVFRDDDSMFRESSNFAVPSGEINEIADAEALKVLSRQAPSYAQLEIGQKHLGRGSQGHVYPARWNGTNVAVKVFDLEAVMDHTSDVERRARKHAIIRELLMVREVCDSRTAFNNIVHLHDAFKRLSSMVVIMECLHCDLGTLQNQTAGLPRDALELLAKLVLGQKKTLPSNHLWPERVVAAVVSDLLMGLSELHDTLRLRHGDIKPSNLLLSNEYDRVKICDFGCCSRIAEERTSEELGSRLYMAPERLAEGSEPPGPASDVWSVGIVACELLTGVHPCETFKARYWQYCENLHRIYDVLPSASKSCRNFLMKCLCAIPSQRATVSQLLRDPFIAGSPLDRRVMAKYLKGLSTAVVELEKSQRRAIYAGLIRLSIERGPKRDHQKENVQIWQTHTAHLRPVSHPHPDDTRFYPPLRK